MPSRNRITGNPIPADVRFFFTHASFSYFPGKETPTDGRLRCARELAAAERNGRVAGLSFEWHVDDVDSSEWSDEKPAYVQWACICHDAEGEAVASLGCIDFGRDGEPWSDPYRRVVEAELAAEALTR